MSKIILNGIEYASTDAIVEVDQATYDSMSEAEKNNGQIYLVRDGIPDEQTASGVKYGDSTVEVALDSLNERFKKEVVTGTVTVNATNFSQIATLNIPDGYELLTYKNEVLGTNTAKLSTGLLTGGRVFVSNPSSASITATYTLTAYYIRSDF